MEATVHYPSLNVTSHRFFNKDLECWDVVWVHNITGKRMRPGDVKVSKNARWNRIRALARP